jgi:hypothetical protein
MDRLNELTFTSREFDVSRTTQAFLEDIGLRWWWWLRTMGMVVVDLSHLRDFRPVAAARQRVSDGDRGDDGLHN